MSSDPLLSDLRVGLSDAVFWLAIGALGVAPMFFE